MYNRTIELNKVNLMENQTLLLITAALTGIAIGALFMYFLSSKGAGSAKSVAKVEEKLTKYQEDVVSHFEQTADLVDELTQSYKKVFDHLGQSARELLTDEQVKAQIEKRKDKKITLAFLAEENIAPEDEDVTDEKDPKDITEEINKVSEESQEVEQEQDGLEKDVKELVEEIEAEMKKPNDA